MAKVPSQKGLKQRLKISLRSNRLQAGKTPQAKTQALILKTLYQLLGSALNLDNQKIRE